MGADPLECGLAPLVLPLWAPVGVLFVYMGKCKGMRVKSLKIDFRGILYKGDIIEGNLERVKKKAPPKRCYIRSCKVLAVLHRD